MDPSTLSLDPTVSPRSRRLFDHVGKSGTIYRALRANSISLARSGVSALLFDPDKLKKLAELRDNPEQQIDEERLNQLLDFSERILRTHLVEPKIDDENTIDDIGNDLVDLVNAIVSGGRGVSEVAPAAAFPEQAGGGTPARDVPHVSD